jgi:hypothetical protein
MLFLLLPSGFFLFMAVFLILNAATLFPNPQPEQSTQARIDLYVRMAQSGAFGPQPDKLMGVLTNSWHGNGKLHEILAQKYAQVLSVQGYFLIAGVVVQVYVILRVKAGFKKRDA